jgi:hypothetical protein
VRSAPDLKEGFFIHVAGENFINFEALGFVNCR